MKHLLCLTILLSLLLSGCYRNSAWYHAMSPDQQTVYEQERQLNADRLLGAYLLYRVATPRPIYVAPPPMPRPVSCRTQCVFGTCYTSCY